MNFKKFSIVILLSVFTVPVLAQGMEEKAFRWSKYNWGITLFVLFILISIIWLVRMYNILVKKQNEVDNSFSTIDVMLKKRYDLLPNLIEVVKQYASHEKETLSKITEMRVKASSGGLNIDQKVKLENELTRTVSNLLVTVENYPDLKASQNFVHLQASWMEIEEQISAARRYFNAAVTDYNNAVEMFPTNIMANWMGYKEHTLFVIPETERGNVSAKALFNN